MTTLVLNGEGLNFTAPLTTSYNYTQQSWGGYWVGTYFNTNWYGQNLTYTTGSLLPSSGVMTDISNTPVSTGIPYFSVSNAAYSLVSSDIGINSVALALNMISSSSTPIEIYGGSGNDTLGWIGGGIEFANKYIWGRWNRYVRIDSKL